MSELYANQAQCMREKYWDERTPEEQLAGLREVVTHMHRQMQIQDRTIQQLRQHVHAFNGDVSIKLPEHGFDDHQKIWTPTSLERKP